MYAEASRLMRDHFWIADMGGVDWAAVQERYRPVLARIGTRDDLSELRVGLQGELGSVARVRDAAGTRRGEEPPAGPARRGPGLDADGTWRVARVVPGESSAPAARSPLAAPGVEVQPGDAVLAVGGRASRCCRSGGVARRCGRNSSRAHAIAGRLPRLCVVVIPLPTEMPLRYQDWVAGRRAASTRRRTAAPGTCTSRTWWPAAGHNCTATCGWVTRDLVVAAARDNNDEHVSSLVLEAGPDRAGLGHGAARPMPYPEDAPREPLVAVTNEQAGSDGDIVTAMIRQLGLGPVVRDPHLGRGDWDRHAVQAGRRDGRHPAAILVLVHRRRLGRGELRRRPRRRSTVPAALLGGGRRPTLDAAVALALEPSANAAATPPDTTDRPNRAAPSLPARH